MSRRALFLILSSALALLLAGCGAKGIKPFPEEDLYVMLAVDSAERDDLNATAHYYGILYENTNNPSYFYVRQETLLSLEEYGRVENESRDALEAKEGDPDEVRRYLVMALYQQEKRKEALAEALKLLSTAREKRARDYVVAADLYGQLGQYQQALRHYQSAYSLSPDPIILDKIAFLLFEKMGKTREAIAYYETHIRVHGCNLYLCQRLATLYAKEGNIPAIITVYKKTYKTFGQKAFAKKIVDLYLLRKDYDGLVEFLKESSFDDKLLFDLLRFRKDRLGAAEVALRIYEEGGDVDFLAQAAMFEFEGSEPKTKETAAKAVERFETVLQEKRTHSYLNYTGYLMIDYDLDVDRGIGLVREALKQEPENLFYQDSLAWGYYKKKRYQKAMDLIRKIREKTKGEEPEINDHYDVIKKACLKTKGCKIR